MRCDRMIEERQHTGTGSGAAEVEDSSKHFGLRRIDLLRVIEGKLDGGGDGTSSVTLIRTPTTTVAVDSGAREYRDELLETLKRNGVIVEKVNVLVTTGTHPLHNGNDSVFSHALQHVMRHEWTKTPEKTGRKVAISNRQHWIDRYLRLEVVPFPEQGTMVLLLHMPSREELIEPASREFAGKIIGITGRAVPSGDDPGVARALTGVKKEGHKTVNACTDNITTLQDLLGHCDYIIPAYGPMFKV
ncbi:MAG: hypothetical protein ACMUHB_00725 [Thermoplasmatota archaeon]